MTTYDIYLYFKQIARIHNNIALADRFCGLLRSYDPIKQTWDDELIKFLKRVPIDRDQNANNGLIFEFPTYSFKDKGGENKEFVGSLAFIVIGKSPLILPSTEEGAIALNRTEKICKDIIGYIEEDCLIKYANSTPELALSPYIDADMKMYPVGPISNTTFGTRCEFDFRVVQNIELTYKDDDWSVPLVRPW